MVLEKETTGIGNLRPVLYVALLEVYLIVVRQKTRRKQLQHKKILINYILEDYLLPVTNKSLPKAKRSSSFDAKIPSSAHCSV